MRRPLFSAPDAFSLTPLLALLPVKGRIGSLAALTSSLYARYEKVQALRRELNPELDRDPYRRFSSEEAMLKQVLDWLTLHHGGRS